MTKESAPGLRFHPTDIELVRYYLKRKVLGKNLRFEGISVVDIYKYAPWDLPGMSGWKSNDKKWYFFCPRERKYASGSRMNRSTDLGYWKTTGRERNVTYNNEVVGKIKTLVFHRGKSPKGHRTDWVMYEYRLQDKELIEKGIDGGIFVLCAIFEKDGIGPKNGAQYGAPFRDEDWIDDSDDVKPEDKKTDAFKLSSISWPSLGTPAIYDVNLPSSSKLPLIVAKPSMTSFSLDTIPSPPGPLHIENDNHLTLSEDDEIDTMLNWFGLDDSSPVEVCNNEGGAVPVNEVDSIFDGFDIYDRLDDLENLELLDSDAPNSYALGVNPPIGNSVSENLIPSGPFDIANSGGVKKEESKENCADNHMESRGSSRQLQ